MRTEARKGRVKGHSNRVKSLGNRTQEMEQGQVENNGAVFSVILFDDGVVLLSRQGICVHDGYVMNSIYFAVVIHEEGITDSAALPMSVDTQDFKLVAEDAKVGCLIIGKESGECAVGSDADFDCFAFGDIAVVSVIIFALDNGGICVGFLPAVVPMRATLVVFVSNKLATRDFDASGFDAGLDLNELAVINNTNTFLNFLRDGIDTEVESLLYASALQTFEGSSLSHLERDGDDFSHSLTSL